MTHTPLEKGRLLTRLFSRPVFSSLCDSEGAESVVQHIRKFALLDVIPGSTLGELYDAAWCELKACYRSEYVYKNEIASRIVFGKHSPRTAALYVEMPIGRSIVDLAVFNGTSTAYEIKTEYDSPRRLSTQTADYLCAFDRVFVVTHPELVNDYACLVPDKVGILGLKRSGALSTFRDAKSNRNTVLAKVIFGCLHRAEYMTALEKHNGYPTVAPSGLVEEVCSEQFASWSAQDAHKVFVQSLLKRKITAGMIGFVESLPTGLRAVGYSTPLSSRHRDRIRRVLETRVV